MAVSLAGLSLMAFCLFFDVDGLGHTGMLDSEMNDKDVSLSQVPTVRHKNRLAFKGCALWLPAAVLCHLQRIQEGCQIRSGKQPEKAVNVGFLKTQMKVSSPQIVH